MNKLMLLLRLQFLNLPGLNPQLYGGTAKTRRRAVLIALGAGFVILALLGTSAMYSVMLAFSLKPLGALELLPTLMMFVASIVVLMTGVYKSVNLLFTFRDYDTLAALPVPGATLLGSRFLMLYLSNLGFMSLILVPALAVYGVMAAPGAGFWVAAVVSFFFIPLLPVLAGTLLGLMIFLAASRFRHSNALTILFSMAAFVLLMAGSTGLSASMASESLGPVAQMAARQITRIYFPAHLYQQALAGSGWALALFVLGSALAAALAVWFLGRRFGRLRALLMARRTRSAYRPEALKARSPAMALFGKEMRRFFASALYVLNGGAGLLLMTLMTLALIILGADQLELLLELPGLASMLMAVLPFLLGLMNAMTAPSACALSLEGKSLSILKSLPVSSRAVLLSKAAVTAVLTGGATVVNALALTIALRPTLLEALWLWILPLLYGFVSAQAGLLFNLRLPNFSWTSEVTVIKQSIPVLLTMLVALALSAPPLALTLLLPPGQTALILPLAALGLAAVNLLLYRLLVTWGVKTYERL